MSAGMASWEYANEVGVANRLFYPQRLKAVFSSAPNDTAGVPFHPPPRHYPRELLFWLKFRVAELPEQEAHLVGIFEVVLAAG